MLKLEGMREGEFKNKSLFKSATYLYIYWWFYPGWPWSTQSCHTFQDREQEIESVSVGRTANTPAVAHLTQRQHKSTGSCSCRMTWERLRPTASVCCRWSSSEAGGCSPGGQHHVVSGLQFTPTPTLGSTHRHRHTHTAIEYFWTKCFIVLQAVMSDTQGKEEC